MASIGRERTILDPPIFDLEEIADDTVCCATLNEIALSGEETLGVGRAVFPDDVVTQGEFGVTTNLVQGHRVRHQLNQPTIRRSGDDAQRSQPQIHPVDLPYSLEEKEHGIMASLLFSRNNALSFGVHEGTTRPQFK